MVGEEKVQKQEKKQECEREMRKVCTLQSDLWAEGIKSTSWNLMVII